MARHYGFSLPRQTHPPRNGAVNSVGSFRSSFIDSKVTQMAVDLLAFVFGIGFLCLCTLGIAAAIAILIYFAVVA